MTSYLFVVSTFLLFFLFIFTSLRLYLSSSLCPNVLMSFLNVAFSCFCLFVFPPHTPFCFLVFLSFCNLLKCLMDGQRGRLSNVPKHLLVENPGDTITPDICHRHHRHVYVKKLPGVNFYRFNTKNWHFSV